MDVVLQEIKMVFVAIGPMEVFLFFGKLPVIELKL